MHFRIRGNSAQIVRTVVDKKTLKSKSVPAGSANIKTGVLSDELLAQLSEKEVLDVRRWIQERQRFENLRKEVNMRFLDQQIYEAVAWLKEAPAAEAETVVAEILRAMNAFKRVAVKRGILKTR